jgi:hypothetical protein
MQDTIMNTQKRQMQLTKIFISAASTIARRSKSPGPKDNRRLRLKVKGKNKNVYKQINKSKCSKSL